MNATPLRILLVEDDELFRLGLSTRLQREPMIDIVAEAIDGERAVELTNQMQPQIVLLDVGLPGIGGVEACRQIKQQHPDLPVLILTSHSQTSLIEQLVSAGASGFCLKGVEAETLILALRSVAAGASWWDQRSTQEIRSAFNGSLSPRVAHRSRDTLPSAPKAIPEGVPKGISQEVSPIPIKAATLPADIHLLTHREQEILALLTTGKSNQEIAEQLHITTGTVRVHVHAVLQKLDVRDRTQAAIFALQHGIVPETLL
jgi:two-component system, NarL family, response regulator